MCQDCCAHIIRFLRSKLVLIKQMHMFLVFACFGVECTVYVVFVVNKYIDCFAHIDEQYIEAHILGILWNFCSLEGSAFQLRGSDDCLICFLNATKVHRLEARLQAFEAVGNVTVEPSTVTIIYW